MSQLSPWCLCCVTPESTAALLVLAQRQGGDGVGGGMGDRHIRACFKNKKRCILWRAAQLNTCQVGSFQFRVSGLSPGLGPQAHASGIMEL